MRYIKIMTQQRLSFLLALYIGLFMNCAVFFRRFDSYAQDFTFSKACAVAIELFGTVLITFFLLRMLSLLGRRAWRVLATLLVLFSAGASYYMTFLNVVIGYGIIASVMTTDIDLSKEVVGLHFVIWLVAVSALPLLFIWSNRCRYTLLRQLRTPGQRLRSVTLVVLAGLM
ncbi:MAG TPA: lipid A phosphoethanolamine transferase, partial [Enterobacteriaceae bacterium]|nr:lipid A phosphoethanolamine transferase [Enterobacteriaceae bacterium]